MTSMSLEFILNKPDESVGPRTRKQWTAKTASVRRRASPATEPDEKSIQHVAHSKNEDPPPLDRQQHVRQLQNLRQRRYRERKRSSASAQQRNAERLKQENSALETAIVQHFTSRM
ncbi:trna (guanine-n2)-methyltransferase [Phytophthora cinnamomi]|uniref:trna (guanine-n2)-methyltransferase n=1 Tax=Phytophthora cinnamomi TaxID=4785 RepID=UPI00355A4432|nr:trna (guanine-n2)-methyltransferase [Phytophthora cinnamomi]